MKRTRARFLAGGLRLRERLRNLAKVSVERNEVTVARCSELLQNQVDADGLRNLTGRRRRCFFGFDGDVQVPPAACVLTDIARAEGMAGKPVAVLQAQRCAG